MSATPNTWALAEAERLRISRRPKPKSRARIKAARKASRRRSA